MARNPASRPAIFLRVPDSQANHMQRLPTTNPDLRMYSANLS
jgi:hypothetical protein